MPAHRSAVAATGGGPRRSPFTPFAVYAAAALLGTVLFIFLHHLGNQIHYRVVAQRFAAEFRTDRPDEGLAAGFKTPEEGCKFSAMVMAGAQPKAPGSSALRDALLLRELVPTSQHNYFCADVEAAANGAALYEQFTSLHYWSGSKAVFALLLRGLSVADIRALIRYGSYAGWIALAVALLLLAPRALVVAAPLIVLGGFFSGIRYFSDIPSGVPHLWVVWAAVTLVVLLRLRLRAARLFCFFTGMVTSYLYTSAGPTILMVTLIGMLVYFVRGGRVEANRGARLAGGCMALCVTGFVAAFALGQAAKLALDACLVPDWLGWRAVCEGVSPDRFVWRNLSDKVLYYLARAVLEPIGGLSGALRAVPALAGLAELLPAGDGVLQALVAPRLQAQTQSWVERAGVPIVRYFEPYWQVGFGSAAAGRMLTWTAAAALAAATAAAVVRACRRQPAALRRVGWIAALMAVAAVLFLAPDDLPYRLARYLFVPYALALCCALAVLMETGFAARAVDTAARALARAQRVVAGSAIVRRLARLDGLPLLLAALGGVGALLVLLRQTTYGPGLTADSALYVSAARSLLGGDGLATFLGAPYREAGPLFPLALAAAARFGADPVTAAGYLNAAAFGLTVYAVAAWVRSRVRYRLVAVWAGCACALSTALAGAAAHVWPDTLFILFAVVSLAAVDRFRRTDARPALLLAAAAAAAAGLTHHAGAALTGVGALLLLRPGTAGWRSRLPAAAVFGGVSAAPLGAWLAGNLLATGAAFGTAGPGAFAPLESLHAATGEIVLWFLGRGGFGLLDRIAGDMAGVGVPAVVLRAAVLLAPAAAVGYALTRHRSRLRPLLAVPLTFAAAYVLYLSIALPAGRTTLESWHLTPLLPPLLVAAALVLDSMIRLVRAAGRKPARRPLAPALAALLAALWFAPQVGATAEHVQRQRANGAGYASRQWAESEVVGYLNAHRPPGVIYGTDPAALYFLTAAAARSAISELPPGRRRVWDRLSAEGAAGREYHVAWFHRGRDAWRYNYGLETVLRTPGMQIVAALDDGVILRRSAAGTARTAARDAAAITPALLQDARIGLRSGFTVHLNGAADRLIYTKYGCRSADVETRFFLHVTPRDYRDRPTYGEFHILNFDFGGHGFINRGLCVAVRALPDFPIARIDTGQFTPRDGQLWKVTLKEPAAQRGFAIHLLGDKLIYRKEPCAAADAQPRFFLDRWRREGSSANLDFDFRDHGWTAGERCRAVVPLPAYEIADIRTGQYGAAGAEPLWTAEFAASRPPPTPPPQFTIAKWFDDHAAAISITYDGEAARPGAVDDLARELGLAPDYEVATPSYLERLSDRVERDSIDLIPDASPGDLRSHVQPALRRGAWIIPVYRNAGANGGEGGYDWNAYQADLRAIAARDFWVAPLNDVERYLQERASAEVTMQVNERDGVTHRIDVLLADGLDNDRFDLPLTLLFRRPADWFDLPVEITQHGRMVARIPAFTETAKLSLLPNEEPYLMQPAYPAPGPPEAASEPELDVLLRSGAAAGASGVHGVARLLLKGAGISQQSEFTVYLDAAAGRLIYTKTGCRAADTAARFFLHVVPASAADLPAGHRFHSLDFDFDDQGLRRRGYCMAVRTLPEFPIARIDTGQVAPRGGQLWKVTLAEPAARRGFAVHLRGDTLIYLQEPCTAAAAQPRFFIDLRRREGGAVNVEFDLREYGWAAGERCRAVVPLPAHEAAAIRTGQYGAAGGEPLWMAEFTASGPPPAPPPAPAIAKWFDDHAAAISITYDGVAVQPNEVDALAQELGLALDYEMVTQRYLDRLPDWVEHDLTGLIPDPVPGDLYEPLTDEQIEYGLSLTDHGFGFFGHGHWHVDHDALSYAQAYDSFRLNFEVMESLGLKPVAYAYPRGAGAEAETQQALADAGFLAGRRSYIDYDQTPYIVPDDETTPENWFFLPVMTMESIDFRQCEFCINDTWELLAHLRQALRSRAWIIPVYHNIGGRAWGGWGFYDWEYFQADLEAIAAHDFWVAPMNDVVLYLREREHAEVTMQVSERDGMTRYVDLMLADGLDNERFDQPLTVLFTPPADWFGAAVEVTRNGQVIARIPTMTEMATLSLLPDEKPYRLQPAPPHTP